MGKGPASARGPAEIGLREIEARSKGRYELCQRGVVPGPDGFSDRTKTVALKQASDPRFDLADQIGAGGDQGRVELDEASARPDLTARIGRAGDPTTAHT